jgi:hypothetical protein
LRLGVFDVSPCYIKTYGEKGSIITFWKFLQYDKVIDGEIQKAADMIIDRQVAEAETETETVTA